MTRPLDLPLVPLLADPRAALAGLRELHRHRGATATSFPLELLWLEQTLAAIADDPPVDEPSHPIATASSTDSDPLASTPSALLPGTEVLS